MLNDTMENVISFYQEFDKTFSVIDDQFGDIDEKGGIDDDLICLIIDKLIEYQKSCYAGMNLREGNEKLETYLTQMKSQNDIDFYLKTIRETQKAIHEILHHDTTWEGENTCISIFEIGLINAKNYIVDCKHKGLCIDRIHSYALVRILRELVSDCSIAIKGLAPLAQWTYGTSNYASLDANQKLMVLINQAILTDRMYFSLQSLRIILGNVNKLLDSFEVVNWNIYYAAGLLNFKIHQYKPASVYFLKIHENDQIKLFKTKEDNKRIFHANLLMAYCEEYNGKFEKAIEYLAFNTETLLAILKKYDIDKNPECFSDIMKEICGKATNDSLVGRYFKDYDNFEKKAMTIGTGHQEDLDQEDLDRQFEILHALSHCMNEYAIKTISLRKDGLDRDFSEEDSRLDGKIIVLSRKLMNTLAKYRPDYWTCYATMHGEYQDYYQAIKELDAIKEHYESKAVTQKETVAAEICFFKYYFGLMLNTDYPCDKKTFHDYSVKYDDDDAQCHIVLFEFKEELRNYCIEFFRNIQDIERENDLYSEENLGAVPTELEQLYEQLCNLTPTLYMNINVRAELRLMQRAYDSITSLRQYFINPNAKTLFNLQNACKRFSRVKTELELGDDNDLSIIDLHEQELEENHESDTNSALPEIITRTFSGNKHSIFSSLYSADSIFILAPISGVVVYQYQTGNINTLFSEEDIFPKISKELENIASNIARLLCANHRRTVFRYGQPSLKNIPWEDLGEYTSIIYCWHELTGSQVVVAEKNLNSYIRIIKDETSFLNAIDSLWANKKKPVPCNDAYLTEMCYVDVKTSQQMPWMEIINEQTTQGYFIIIWTGTNLKSRKCYIVPVNTFPKGTKEKKAKIRCKIHTFVRHIDVNYNSGRIRVSPESQEGTEEQEQSIIITDSGRIGKAKVLCEALLSSFTPLLQDVQDRIGTNTGEIVSPTTKSYIKRKKEMNEDKQTLTNYIGDLCGNSIEVTLLETIEKTIKEIDDKVRARYGM